MHKDINIYKQNPIKKVLFLVFGLTLLIGMCTPISAFQLKYYGWYGKFENCLDCAVPNLPEKYLVGIKAIRYFEKENNNYQAYYFLGGVIDIYGNKTTMLTLIHELAHHCQFVRHDTAYNIKNHLGKFNECYEEITNATV